MRGGLFNQALAAGCRDYVYLLDRQYADKGALELVCNRYQLNSYQRVILYRGVFSKTQSRARQQKLLPGYGNGPLHVDLLNVLFTVVNYLYGRTLFRATDGLVKDIGACFAKPAPGEILQKAINWLAAAFINLAPSGLQLYMDVDYDYSRYVAVEMGRHLGGQDCILAVKNPDYQLAVVTSGVIATSDSQVIDQSTCRVFDLASQILHQHFKLQLTDLSRFLQA